MNVVRWLTGRPDRAAASADEERGIGFDEWATLYMSAAAGGWVPKQTLLGTPQETPDGSLTSYTSLAYRSNGAVFACILARMSLFSEARIVYQALRSGKPGDIFSGRELEVLSHPYPGATTGDLLARAILDVDLAGNFYAGRLYEPDRIKRLRPDWVTIVYDQDPRNIEAEVIGYAYQPGGPGSGLEVEAWDVKEIAHWAPVPDPLKPRMGMPWVLPVIREVMGDKATTEHKLRYFENGATPNLVVSLSPNVMLTPDEFEDWVSKMEGKHKGVRNAYRTMYLANGATALPVGGNLREIDFKITQGAGETRIAAAAGVPPVIAGFSEGLAAATYSNYGQARRRFADLTARPLWRNFCGSMEQIIPAPNGATSYSAAAARLWYDDRDIAFLREDQKDAAEALWRDSLSIQALFSAGYDAESIVQAVTARDLSRLRHTGAASSQVVQPGEASTPATDQAGRGLALLLAPYLNGGPST